MVFRRDSKVDAFQRQISALRHQLGGEHDDFSMPELDRPRAHGGESRYRGELPAPETLAPTSALVPREYDEHRELDPFGMSSPAIPAIDAQTSVIAPTTSWNGNLESTGSLHIHGRVEGSLTARDEVFIAEEADVDAVVSAASVTVAGKVRGSISCANRFEVLPRGRVVGDVHAPVIVIHEGAIVAGDIAMATSGDHHAHFTTASARAVRGGD